MVGIVLGLGSLILYVSLAISGGWGAEGSELIGTGAAVAAGALVVGLVAPTTVGIAAMWAMFGAAIAAIIEFAQGDVTLGIALLFHALFFFLLQHLILLIRGGGQGIFGRNRRGSVATTGGFDKPVWKVARGYFGVIDVTMLDQGGGGHFALFADGTSEFVTTKGVRWAFEPRDWTGWRVETDQALLDDLPGLDGSHADVIVLTGSVAAFSPDVYVEVDDLDAWAARLSKHGITRTT